MGLNCFCFKSEKGREGEEKKGGGRRRGRGEDEITAGQLKGIRVSFVLV